MLVLSWLQNLLKAAGATQKQLHLVKLHEQSKKNLEQEIQNYKEEAQKQRKIIYQLEKERDRYINEASDLTQKVSLRLINTILCFCSSFFFFLFFLPRLFCVFSSANKKSS